MKKNIFFFLWLVIPLFCMAQSLDREYDYDEAGNRILRKTISINPAPPAPLDSLHVTSDS